LSEFLLVRDRDRRVLDDRLNSRREGLLAAGSVRGFSGLGGIRTHSASGRPSATLRRTPLVSRTRRRHFHRPACSEPAGSAVELLLLARGRYHELVLRYWSRQPPTPRHTCHSWRRRQNCWACRRLAGLSGASGPPDRPFRPAAPRIAFFRAPSSLSRLQSHHSKIDRLTADRFDRELHLTFDSCPTSR
jgi:hypothetical protein